MLKIIGSWRAVVVMISAICLAVQTGLGAPTNEPPVQVFVMLDGPAAAQVHLSLRGAARADVIAAVQARQAEIRRQQEALVPQIEALGGVISGRFQRLANALRVSLPAASVPALGALPGVVRMVPVPQHEPHTETSVPFIGATNVWARLVGGATGKGLRLGIIDSGIDYLHADFGGAGDTNEFLSNNSAILEPGTFPTAKVAGGWDFAGDAYNGGNAPTPDPDPLDCAANGHGSHVAGIAAGAGVLTNRTAYAGPYTNGLNLSQFLIGPGVAPEATLYALKVFGCSGTTGLVLDALEWASDPNNNGDFTDRLDVLNLSLGSPFGLTGPGDPEQDAIATLAALGCLSVVSAGNSGNTFYIVGSPAVAEPALAVANTIDDGSTRLAVQVLTPAAIATNYFAVEATFTPPLAALAALQAQITAADPLLACSALVNAGSLAGRIALVDRGTCDFTDKVLLAQNAGAVAVIVVNNAPGQPFAMGGTPILPITIPAVMISQPDGAVIKAQLAGTVIARLAGNGVIRLTELADQLEVSSSRGPASMAGRLKPEIAAPGSSIVSVKAGGGFQSRALTGTSMAAPHVVGCAALLRQLHPAWPVADLKAALMNTSRPARDAGGNPYAESLVGAGRVQVDDAAATLMTARVDDPNGLVALSFGALTLSAPLVVTQHVVLRNFGPAGATLSVSVSNSVTENGCVLSPVESSVTVPSGGEARVGVRLAAHPGLFDRTSDPTTPATVNGRSRTSLFEASGQVWFRGGAVPLHVPFHASLRAGAAYSSDFASVVGAVSNLFEIPLPMTGGSAHPQPLVGVFQLGAASPPANESDPARALADLLAVGAASDAPARGTFSGAVVYFGIATAGDWTSAGGFTGAFTVQIDTNNNDTADLTLVNSNQGNFAAGLSSGTSANDIFMPVLVVNTTRRTNLLANVFAPNVRDTALFNNSVMVLPVPASALGLGVARSSFRYRVQAEAASQRAGTVDLTPWISFDAAKPVVDGTRAGLSFSPFRLESGTVPVTVDRSAAAANGFTAASAVGVLLLRPFNPPGQRAEIVTVLLDSNSVVPLKLLAPAVAAGGGHALRWTSSAAKTYSILGSMDLNPGFNQVIASGIPGTPPWNAFTNALPPLPGTRFYRVRED